MFVYSKRQKKQSILSAVIILNVLGLTLGSLVGFSYLVLPQLTKLAHAQEDYSTALPWIASEDTCKGDALVWTDGACWDGSHEASF